MKPPSTEKPLRMSAVQRWTPVRYAIASVMVAVLVRLDGSSSEAVEFMTGQAVGVVLFAVYLMWVDRGHPDTPTTSDGSGLP
jgi:hypothetical protein